MNGKAVFRKAVPQCNRSGEEIVLFEFPAFERNTKGTKMNQALM